MDNTKIELKYENKTVSETVWNSMSFRTRLAHLRKNADLVNRTIYETTLKFKDSKF
jgi:hypothetical protein